MTDQKDNGRVAVDPMAAASEAMAMNDFLKNQSLINANNAVILSKRVKELEATIEENQKTHDVELVALRAQHDQAWQQCETLRAEVVKSQDEIQSLIAERNKLKSALESKKAAKNGK